MVSQSPPCHTDFSFPELSDLRPAAIAATGLYTPPHAISNAELVEAFNAYVERFNAANAEAIEAGELEALTPSSVEFIEKASGIKSRFVVDKAGILDPAIMRPQVPSRSNEELSLLAEMAVKAAEQALERWGKPRERIGAVLCAASNMQRAYPAMAVEVQDALGLGGFAFDMNVACSSATFGIKTAADYIATGSADAVLMVNPEICSAQVCVSACEAVTDCGVGESCVNSRCESQSQGGCSGGGVGLTGLGALLAGLLLARLRSSRRHQAPAD